jgi:hypothetical protein
MDAKMPPKKPAPDTREGKLALALRANLRRRKAGEGTKPPTPEGSS